jgi:hypothetical protein
MENHIDDLITRCKKDPNKMRSFKGEEWRRGVANKNIYTEFITHLI